MRESLTEALSGFAGGGSPRDRAGTLLHALGYRSERTAEVGGVDAFVALLEQERPLTKRQRGLFRSWRQEKEIDRLVYTLYGLSEAEIAAVEKSRP